MKKKAQLNLDLFLNLKSKKKQFFYIDWNEENPYAKWLYKKPKEANWSNVVKWNKVGDVIICCRESEKMEIDSSLNKKIIEQINSNFIESETKIISFLKSHLQKSIRRQKQIQSIESAFILLKLNKNEILRRLSIIMFEDTKMKKYFLNLFWLIVSVSKDYILKEFQIDLILKYVSDLSLYDKYDKIEISKSENEEFNPVKFIEKIELSNKLSDLQKDILYCITFRISYGGMLFDKNMLIDYAYIWFDRFENKKNDLIDDLDIEKNKDINIKFALDNKFKTINDFVYQSVDFHCFPYLIKNIYDECNNEYSEEQIKKCIWEYNSKINTRKDNSVDLKENPNLNIIWNNIEKKLTYQQEHILINLIDKINSY